MNININVNKNISKLNDAKKIAKILNLLSSPVRLLIVCALLEKEKTVTELLQETGTTIGNISQHLRRLEDNGILTNRKDANKVYYSIKNKNVAKFINGIKELCQKIHNNLI